MVLNVSFSFFLFLYRLSWWRVTVLVPICLLPVFSGPESAWIQRNRSPLFSLAILAFSLGSWYISEVRVGTILTFGNCFFNSATSLIEMARVISFSFERSEFSYWPVAPPSCPPWPASTTIVLIVLPVCARAAYKYNFEKAKKRNQYKFVFQHGYSEFLAGFVIM